MIVHQLFVISCILSILCNERSKHQQGNGNGCLDVYSQFMILIDNIIVQIFLIICERTGLISKPKVVSCKNLSIDQ